MRFATLAAFGGVLTGAAFALAADAAEPKLLDASKADTGPVTLLTEEDLEPEPQGAYNPETGEINWDCPCLGGMAHGPCGEEFKAAFSCFVYSKEDPKGKECIEKFSFMQDCFRKHPEVYAEQLADDELAKEEPTVVEKVDKAGLELEKKVGETSKAVVAKVNEVEAKAEAKAAVAMDKVEAAVESAATKAKSSAAATVSKLTPDAKNESSEAQRQAHEFRNKVHNSNERAEHQLSGFAEDIASDVQKLSDKFTHRNEETANEFRGVANEFSSDSHHAADSTRRTGYSEDEEHLKNDMHTFANKVSDRVHNTAENIRNLGK